MAKENTAILKDKKDKKIQASLLESPEATSWKFDSKTTPSQNISRLSSSMDSGKSKDNRDNLRASAKSILPTTVTKVSKLELELESTKRRFEEMTNNYQKEIENKKISEGKLLGEVEKAKATVDEAVKLQKEIDLRCQHKIAEMVALMEKHKHQYDKIVEERDSELGLYKSREQEQSSAKIALETELSNIRNELVSLKKQLEIEKEEKEKLKMAKENTAILKDKKDKKIQASLLESPEATSWKFDSKTTPSQNISRLSSSMDSGKSKDNRDNLRASAKSILPTTVTKSLVSEEDVSNRLYDNNPPDSHLLVKTPKQTPLSLSTPASFMKFGSLKKMREDRWTTIAKIDRKRRLKEAEKLFS